MPVNALTCLIDRDILENGQRDNIFESSLLVLSKCDMIKSGHENRAAQLMEGVSDALKKYPFK